MDVRDIDTDLSVTDQLTEAGKAVENVWNVVRQTVDEKIENVLDTSGGA